MPNVEQMTRERFREYVAGVPATHWRDGVAIHHTAMEKFGLEGAVAVMNYHLSIGWRDAGYHCIIDPEGTLYVYRMRPMEDSGAHIGDPWNQSHIGVSLQGNYNNRYPTPEMADTLRFVVETIGQRYGTGMNYIFHRDVDATACPGYNITHPMVDQWFTGNTGYQPPVVKPPAELPPVDLSFPTKPIAPTQFTFIKGSGECLGLDDVSPQVRELEQCLFYLGYLDVKAIENEIGRPYSWSYEFDKYTLGAVTAFQAAFVPPADGIYGQFTAAALQKEIDRKWSGHPVDVVPPPPVVPPVVIEPPDVVDPVDPPQPEAPGWFARFIEALIQFLQSWLERMGE